MQEREVNLGPLNAALMCIMTDRERQRREQAKRAAKVQHKRPKAPSRATKAA